MLKEITGRDWAVEHAARDDLPARHQRKRARKIAMAACLRGPARASTAAGRAQQAGPTRAGKRPVYKVRHLRAAVGGALDPIEGNSARSRRVPGVNEDGRRFSSKPPSHEEGPTPVSKRVTPSERLRAEVDEVFAGGADLVTAIEQVARIGARLLLQTALEAEATEFLGRARYARAASCEDAREGSRNGYCETTIKTTSGPVTLARPKLRNTTEAFASQLLGTCVTKT